MKKFDFKIQAILEDISTDNMLYDVVMIGGSIGKSINSKRELKDNPVNAKTTLMSYEKAVEKQKRMNKALSPGEKNYYGIKYVVAEVDPNTNKYTGK